MKKFSTQYHIHPLNPSLNKDNIQQTSHEKAVREFHLKAGKEYVESFQEHPDVFLYISWTGSFTVQYYCIILLKQVLNKNIWLQKCKYSTVIYSENNNKL